MEKKFLSYEDFGAKGDGVTDDIEAIIACHEEANKTGTPIKTKDDATYYIGGRDIHATIKTDVDFGKSNFIIDDRNVENRTSHIFYVVSDYEVYDVSIPSLSKYASKLDIPHNGDNLFVYLFNEEHNIYIREGLNKNAGVPTKECITVDKDGNIFPCLTWDYPAVTKAHARCTDDKPITIKGGIFKTIANQGESFYHYHSRGFSIKRSHLTVENITHYVEGELDHGAPYAGFLNMSESVDCTIQNCLLTPHFIYSTESKIPGKLVRMGSYDINVSSSIGIKLLNITQTIDIMDNRYWGIIHTNFCKNLHLENCTLSRYDAHEGVANITIKGCKFGHMAMNLIGFGEAVIENTCIFTNHFIAFRGDYGSFWHGNIKIKNCRWEPTGEKIVAFQGNNKGKHYFGYDCSLPTNISIDGLYISDKNVLDGEMNILPYYDDEYSNDKPYKYGTTKKLILKNIITESGREISITKDMALYEGIEIIKK